LFDNAVKLFVLLVFNQLQSKSDLFGLIQPKQILPSRV